MNSAVAPALTIFFFSTLSDWPWAEPESPGGLAETLMPGLGPQSFWLVGSGDSLRSGNSNISPGAVAPGVSVAL